LDQPNSGIFLSAIGDQHGLAHPEPLQVGHWLGLRHHIHGYVCHPQANRILTSQATPTKPFPLGVAFSDSSCTSVRDIQLITDWPGARRNVLDEKVPSQVAYGDFTKVHKHYNWGTWGNQIPPGVPRQSWTKLRLDESNRSRQLELILALLTDNLEGFKMRDGGEEDEDGESPPLYPSKEPVDVVTDFLTGVKDYAYEAIQTNLTKALFNSLPIEIVITVPAVWSDKAKNLTFQAVSRAGFADKAKLKMVTEPEAAAVYTMKSLREKYGQDFIKVGGGVW
jgi:hypothetical protein